MGVEHIVVALFLACAASVPMILWNSRALLLSPLAALLGEALSVLRLFGLALLLVVSLIAGIAIWEYAAIRLTRWSSLASATERAASALAPGSAEATPRSEPNLSDRSRSLLPVVLLVAGLSVLAALDMSLFSSAGQPPLTPPRPAPLPPKSAANSLVFQFASALLTLGLVVAFVVFNKDEYRAWKARRRLSKSTRRRARQGTAGPTARR